MLLTKKYLDDLTYDIVGCAIEVHKQIGPGLLESIYEKCFLFELSIKGLKYKAQQTIPIKYKGELLDAELRYDVLVEDLIVTELKSYARILPIHQAVLLSYMRLLEKPKGILINFNCTNIFKDGKKTMVNQYYASLP
jgi:GxxExxY protein